MGARKEDRAAGPPYAHVFGCSHARFFHLDPGVQARLSPANRALRLGGRAIRAASVAGFRPRTSTLKVRTILCKALPRASRLALAFGQVDLELGYYYRRAVKGEVLTPEGYVDWLVGIYRAFLEELDFLPDRTAVKGANLTVLTTAPFTARYVTRVAAEGVDTVERAAIEDRIEALLLSERAQNGMILGFNAAMRDWCVATGRRYFDINDRVARVGADGRRDPALGLDPVFQPAEDDHHLVASLSVCDAHFDALRAAFG